MIFDTLQVFIATRSGSWVHNRVAENGMPFDMIQSRGLQTIFRNCFPRNFLLNKAEARANARFDHAAYGLRPKHRINAQHATVNDDLPNRIICGSVVVKPNVKRLTKTGVEFEDGTYEDNIDAVIYATGYIFGFPFLDEDIIKVEKNVVRLFKYVFPPELKPSTLAIIGCFQPLGALMPLSEIQCRWATRVFKVNFLLIQNKNHRFIILFMTMCRDKIYRIYLIMARALIIAPLFLVSECPNFLSYMRIVKY